MSAKLRRAARPEFFCIRRRDFQLCPRSGLKYWVILKVTASSALASQSGELHGIFIRA